MYFQGCIFVAFNVEFLSKIQQTKIKSDNLQYNTLVRWADGTNDSATKGLTFQVFFFS